MGDEAPQSPDEQYWDVFICNRQADGGTTAEWLYNHLEDRQLLAAGAPSSRIRCYLDRRAAAVGNWRELNRTALEKARAMIVVCTAAAAIDRGPKDEVKAEIQWWIDNRQTAPILIDIYKLRPPFIPHLIKQRWPDAQLVNVCLEEWAKQGEAERVKLRDSAVSRVTQGIVISERQVRDEELEESRRLRKELEVALAEAHTQRNVATAALLAARGELLIDEGVLSSAQCGALLVAECLHRVPRTLQGHRAWAKAMSFFPPQIEEASLPVANGVPALSIGRAKNVVAVGSANRTIVLDVAAQSRYWFDHKGAVQAVAVDPSGAYLATRAEGETVRLWNLLTKELVHEWPNNEKAVSLLFANSQTVLASCDRTHSQSVPASSDRTQSIRLWDYRLKFEDRDLHSFDIVRCLGAFSDDDKFIAALVDHGQLEDDVAVAWTLIPRDRDSSIGGYLKGGIKDVAFSSDHSLIATTGFDHLAEVRPFTPGSGISAPFALATLRGGVGQAIAFDPNGGRVAIAGEDRVRLWDFRSQREVGTIQHGQVLRLAFDTSGDVLTTVTAQDVRQWAVTLGKNLAHTVQSTRKALEPERIMDMIPPMRDRIGRDLTEVENAEYLGPESVE